MFLILSLSANLKQKAPSQNSKFKKNKTKNKTNKKWLPQELNPVFFDLHSFFDFFSKKKETNKKVSYFFFCNQVHTMKRKACRAKSASLTHALANGENFIYCVSCRCFLTPPKDAIFSLDIPSITSFLLACGNKPTFLKTLQINALQELQISNGKTSQAPLCCRCMSFYNRSVTSRHRQGLSALSNYLEHPLIDLINYISNAGASVCLHKRNIPYILESLCKRVITNNGEVLYNDVVLQAPESTRTIVMWVHSGVITSFKNKDFELACAAASWIENGLCRWSKNRKQMKAIRAYKRKVSLLQQFNFSEKESIEKSNVFQKKNKLSGCIGILCILGNVE